MLTRVRDLALAAAAYLALTLALTWPVARGITRHVAGDFGDPLLNSWILSWDADHLLRALRGDFGMLAGYFDANIFYPHPLALAYSEHLTAQALTIFPIYALTRNPILCYNLVFLSTFFLSGVGMFLFARDLTGSRGAAFVAGLAFAFAPYRFGTIPHVQVLSSYWMPFALLGFRRFFETGRILPLAGGAVAWTLQNLSCGYYLLYFSTIVALYVIWELSARRLWTSRRALLAIAIASAAVVAATLPFALPYLELRRLGFSPRSISETDHFSADVYGYFTADPNLRVSGAFFHAWPHAENALFPGVTIAALALVAILSEWRRVRQRMAKWKGSLVARLLALVVFTSAAIAVALVLGWSLRGPLKITSITRVLVVAVAASACLLAVSRRYRTALHEWASGDVLVLAAITIFAIVMSFGPHIRAHGRIVQETNLYALFFDYVPGYDGLRVPARFGMVAAFGLAALAGIGVSRLSRRSSAWILAASVAIAVEALAIPVTIDYNDTAYRQSVLAPLPDRVDDVPAVYDFVGSLPREAAIVELPLGEPAFDVRYEYFSTRHWRPLVNGYSGGAPVEYGMVAERLGDFATRPDAAWQALLDSRATHVVVHEAAYLDGRGPAATAWLRDKGAREVAAFGSDRVFQLRHPF